MYYVYNSRKPASRDSLHRGNKLPAETAARASNRQGLVVCQGLWHSPPSVCRILRARGRSNRPWKTAETMERDWKIELIERENLEWRDLSDLLD